MASAPDGVVEGFLIEQVSTPDPVDRVLGDESDPTGLLDRPRESVASLGFLGFA
jgi:hypothetical protein